MRPTPPEVIRGVSSNLMSGVLPELATPWAQAQLRYALTVLDSVANEWDGAVENLVRENAALQRFCRLAADTADQTPGDDLAARRQALVEAAALPATPDLRVSKLSARNDLLWSTVEPLVELIGGSDGTEDWYAPLRAELQPLLRAYVAARQWRRGG